MTTTIAELSLSKVYRHAQRTLATWLERGEAGGGLKKTVVAEVDVHGGAISSGELEDVHDFSMCTIIKQCSCHTHRLNTRHKTP